MMERRTRIFFFILLTVVLFGLVGWFIVWPTIKPLLPADFMARQPPALPAPNPPVVPVDSSSGTTPSGDGVATFDPTPSPDAFIIASLERRAGVLAERVESGSSEDGFTNYDDASLDASPTLAEYFQSLKRDMRKAHPAAGASYVVTARRLVEQGESDSIADTTFNVRVQLQASVRSSGSVSTEYREATITFTQVGSDWIASRYTVKPYLPE
jgi:hypothetical protein